MLVTLVSLDWGGPAFTTVPASTTGQNRQAVEVAGRGRSAYQWLDERVTETACSFLEGQSSRDDSTPFAAVVSYLLPHCPFIGPRDLFDYYYDRVTVPPVEDSQPASIVAFRESRGILTPPLPAERIRVARAAYYAMVEYVDLLIGRVLESLERSGLAKDTLVLYCSDHGEMAGEHGCWWKSTYYEGSANVPLIARLPGVVAAGRTSDTVCNLVDVGPTALAAAGADGLPRSDGRSLWDELQSGVRPSSWQQQTFSELVDRLQRDGEPVVSRMVRRDQYKFWRTFRGERELPATLFDLNADPEELSDMAAAPDAADVVAELSALITADGWDPAAIASESLAGEKDYQYQAEWTKAVRPAAPYQVPMPPPFVDTDVELL